MRTYIQPDRRQVDCATETILHWMVDTTQEEVESMDERTVRESIQDELALAIREALRCLTPKERRVIKLRYLSGDVKTYREVSKQTGFTLSWTHTLIKRAEAKLGAKLKEIL
jgi:RNA polymerase sigma factor (sigma-70 family)